jgi:prevent-host-death family protein
MSTVGTFEAKTHLTQLLERVARGERIVITNRGKPVAMLVPPEVEETKDAARVGREMLGYRDRVKRTLGGSFRELAHEGHRFSPRRVANDDAC